MTVYRSKSDLIRRAAAELRALTDYELSEVDAELAARSVVRLTAIWFAEADDVQAHSILMREVAR